MLNVLRKTVCVSTMLLVPFILLLTASPCLADFNEWAWESGNDTISKSGIYGELGEAHPDNIPGAREQSISWTDENGDLWLFGGYGLDSVSIEDYMNKL